MRAAILPNFAAREKCPKSAVLAIAVLAIAGLATDPNLQSRRHQRNIARRGIGNRHYGGMRILVLDDHPLFAEALGAFLRVGRPEIEIVAAGSIAEGQTALARAGSVQLIVADLNMPGMAGGTGIEILRACAPAAPIAVVSGEAAHPAAARMRALGAAGFVSKTLRPALLRAAILLIAEGGTYFPESSDSGADAPSHAAQFTARERVILKAIAGGQPNKQIAVALLVEEVTVKAHVTRLLAKTGLRNRVQLALYAVKNDLGT
jgi:two-component system, NarL family, nitrate/nitrite response regulator NarL